jgi:prepilin-type N-terminal cleavage/methylation domain-containing protein
MMRRLINNQSGFSLTETLVSLSIFSLITIGMAPLMAGSIRGTAMARSYTVGKNFAAEAMERVRGFPFFESTKGAVTPPRQDVLDLYFPDRAAGGSGSGYNSTANTFTTICSNTEELPASSAGQACPQNIPDDFTATFVASFVKPAAEVAGQQQFTVVAPPSNYSWTTVATEPPPSQLLKMTVTATWTFGAQEKTFDLTTLIGPRQASEEALRGASKIDYVIQARTGYLDALSRSSSLTATAGTLESRVGVRGSAGSDQSTRAGQINLVRDETTGATVLPALTLSDVFGASFAAHALPNSGPTTTVAGQQTLNHPDIVPSLPIAFLDSSNAENGQVSVEGDRLLGTGTFIYNNGVGNPSFWVDNQSTKGTAPLRLDGIRKLLVSSRISGGSLAGTGRLSGTTAANAYALTDTSGGRVETTANANFGKIALMPTNFIGSGDGTVLTISDFRADLSCKAVAGVGTPHATGSWSATVTYWADTNPNDNLAAGGLNTTVLRGYTTGAGTPVSIDSIGNPKVYDAPEGQTDIYLFETATTTGYFQKISSTTTIPSTVSADGSSASVTLPGAIQINTVATNSAIPNSALNVSIGQMSCEAVDNR